MQTLGIVKKLDKSDNLGIKLDTFLFHEINDMALKLSDLSDLSDFFAQFTIPLLNLNFFSVSKKVK